jgi:hypothetical protein
MIFIRRSKKIMPILAGTMTMALVFAAICPPARTADTIQEAGMEQAKRSAPKVKPVIFGGIRYEVARGLRARATGQASGVLAATEISSGKELWTRPVYEVSYDGAEEDDAQDIFIVRLALNASKDMLLVEDEQDRRYRVRLSDGEPTVEKP